VTLEIRTVAEDKVDAYFAAVSAGFGEVSSAEALDEWRTVAEYDQSFGALDGGRFVGGVSAYSFDMTIPGGQAVPVGGVSNVAIAPTHRRRGIVSALLGRQLDDLAERGTHVAILNASESRIYRRFGYGLATSAVAVEIDTRHTEYLVDAPAGQLRLVPADEARKVFPAFYDRWRRGSVGALGRSEAWWDIMLGPKEGWKGGGEAFHLVYEGPGGEVEGCASYQLNGKTDHGNFQSTVRVRELIGSDAGAEAALWRFCFDLDLVRKARAEMRPVDDPIRWRLVEPRQLKTLQLGDVLWVRLIDVAEALSARGYAAEGAVTFGVDDPFRPAGSGTYRLDAGVCTRVDGADPDLSLDVADLGAAFLGGVSFATLHAAGLVDERRPGAVVTADALFRTPRLPYCATTF
jgi:predicted acetyltransferase